MGGNGNRDVWKMGMGMSWTGNGWEWNGMDHDHSRTPLNSTNISVYFCLSIIHFLCVAVRRYYTCVKSCLCDVRVN